MIPKLTFRGCVSDGDLTHHRDIIVTASWSAIRDSEAESAWQEAIHKIMQNKKDNEILMSIDLDYEEKRR